MSEHSLSVGAIYSYKGRLWKKLKLEWLSERGIAGSGETAASRSRRVIHTQHSDPGFDTDSSSRSESHPQPQRTDPGVR